MHTCPSLFHCGVIVITWSPVNSGVGVPSGSAAGRSFIGESAWGDPRSVLLGEIEDCLDDATGKTAYPELLDAATLWSPAQCAAVLDALVRLRARAKAHPDESRAKALRAVGLR